jgi:hypothetical protein
MKVVAPTLVKKIHKRHHKNMVEKVVRVEYLAISCLLRMIRWVYTEMTIFTLLLDKEEDVGEDIPGKVS